MTTEMTKSRPAAAPQLSVAGGGAPTQIAGQYRTGVARHTVADPARAREVLGFTAKVVPRMGLREIANAPLRD
jgi:dTDP-L-rhamnose 4-epimerase